MGNMKWIVVLASLLSFYLNFYMQIVSKGLFKSFREFKLTDKKLGNGSFGVVNLALHRPTGRLYAVKIIDLKTVPSSAEMKLVQRQIRLHSKVQHPHIVTLWDTLYEEGNIYMFMDYAEEGNLFFYQNTKHTFSEVEAALFFCQTAQAVAHLHSLDIMHRDLKPENLLLDRNLNIKLCDFGWCAQNVHTQRATFCGTYQYMAPEMLFNNSYDYRIDFWALGILLYELVHGHAPFRGETSQQVKQHMLQGSYELSDNLSQSLKQLITSILKFDPNQRLTLKEMLNSQWVKSMQDLIQQCAEELDHSTISNLHSKLAQKCQQKNSTKTHSSFAKDHPHTKNISFNISINSFAVIKSDRSEYTSPSNVFVEKKKKKEKEEKRCRTQAENQLLELAHSLSPIRKKQTLKNIDRKPRVERKARFYDRISQQCSQKSPFRRFQNSMFSGGTSSKFSSILKKKSPNDKLSSVVNSMKSIHKIKTGRANLLATGNTAR